MSRRIEALRRAVEEEGAGPVESFWKVVTDEGTPLVEPTEGDGDGVLLTFLWRAQEEVANVAVVGGPGGAGANRLHHLEGTDLWHRSWWAPADSRFTYRFLENLPDGSDEPGPTRRHALRALSAARPDPLNPRTFRLFPGEGPVRFRRDLVSSVVELPGAPPQPWAEPRPGQPSGRVEEHRFGSRILGNERQVWIYLPPDNRPDLTPAGWVLAFDGSLMAGDALRLPTTLDNLAGAGLIPPLVAVMVGNPDPPTRLRELPCFPPFVDFLARELVPWVQARHPVPSDPARAIVAGASHGGLAAAFAALRRPDLFGRVLSNSGSYWWSPPEDPEPEWLARQLAASRVPPGHCYLDVGRFERGDGPPGAPDTLTCNRHFRDVLVAKGSRVHYGEFTGGHDPICWRGTLADGLVALTQGWAER